MKIGMNLHSYPVPLEEDVLLLKKHGFEATFCGSSHPQLEEAMRLCRREGIEVASYHAPFGGINNIWMDVPAGENMLSELMQAVDNCHRFEVPVLVVHLSSGEAAPRVNDTGLARFDRLMAYAKEKGVTIAYENQRKIGNLAVVIEAYPEAGFCWDCGHEACFAYGRDYMPQFGHRLVALHIHDNHGVHNEDEHMLPFDATLDFDRVAREIAVTPFRGPFMLEVMRNHSKYYGDVSVEEYYDRAAKAARRVADEIERLRGNM